jgi:crotonobetainyl-CoA:carnitine CoA-transferase CaiB-like acyl-CoA transferase
VSEGALQGIRAIELGQGVSAPFCAKLFGDYGADVVKVEPPGSGDITIPAAPTDATRCASC